MRANIVLIDGVVVEAEDTAGELSDLSDKFLGRFAELAAQGRGTEPDHARWDFGMLRATAPDGLIYGYADWELPGVRLPAVGCTADVKIPLPRR